RRDPGGKVAVGNEPDARPGLPHISDKLLVPRPVKTDHRKIIHVTAESASDVLKVLADGGFYIDRSPARWADDDLVHVNVRSVKQAAAFGSGKHRDRVIRTQSAKVRTFKRIDRDVDLWEVLAGVFGECSAAKLLANVEHGSLIPLALAYDDPTAHRYGVHHLSHCLDRNVVAVLAIALAHRLGRF